MKTLQILILILLLYVSFGCGKKDKPQEESATPHAQQGTQTPVPESPDDKKVVMQINEQNYTNKDFKNFIKVQYSGIAEESPNPRLLSRLFDSYQEQKLIGYVASRENIQVSQAEYEGYIAKLDKPGPNQPPMDKVAITETIMIQKFLDNRVYSSVDVTRKEIEAYYKTHTDDYRTKQQVLLHQILVPNREQALKIIGELNNNPDRFEEIARAQSISLEKNNGGKMGYFEEGTLPQDMEKAVFSLKINSISPVFESSYGFHIFKISERKKERLQFIDKVAPEIKNIVMSEKLSNALKNFMDQSKQELKISITYDNLYFKYQPVDGGDEINKGEPNNEKTTSTDTEPTDY